MSRVTHPLKFMTLSRRSWGWYWQCDLCGADNSAPERDKAIEQFRQHRNWIHGKRPRGDAS